MGGTELQRISRAGKTVLARLMESHIWHQPTSSVALCRGAGLGKGQWPLPTLLSERKLSPSSHLMLYISVPPSMPLVPFKLLPQCWSSEGVNLSNSICGFFKGNYLGLQKFLPLNQSQLVFAARSYVDLSFWHWNLGLGT